MDIQQLSRYSAKPERAGAPIPSSLPDGQSSIRFSGGSDEPSPPSKPPALVVKENACHWKGYVLPCAVGKGGIRKDKREGDGASPAGTFELRKVHYRPDKIDNPGTGLPVSEIKPDDGWVDDENHPDYNHHVKLPVDEGVSHEKLFREKDDLYDLVVEVGYNDKPPVPGMGSAIFLHVARPGFSPTAGCVAFNKEDLQKIVESLKAGDQIRLIPDGQEE